MDYIFTKSNINLSKLQKEILPLVNIDGLSYSDPELTVHVSTTLTQEQLDSITTVITNHNPVDMDAIIQAKIDDAVHFGKEIMDAFKRENILMGITQAGKTKAVHDYLHWVEHYVSSGSLYAGKDQVLNIINANNIPADLSPFVTVPRLTIFVNKILVYLELPTI
jgi:hypothetical protein